VEAIAMRVGTNTSAVGSHRISKNRDGSGFDIRSVGPADPGTGKPSAMGEVKGGHSYIRKFRSP